MRLNKFTVALAASGVTNLASAVMATEKANTASKILLFGSDDEGLEELGAALARQLPDGSTIICLVRDSVPPAPTRLTDQAVITALARVDRRSSLRIDTGGWPPMPRQRGQHHQCHPRHFEIAAANRGFRPHQRDHR